MKVFRIVSVVGLVVVVAAGCGGTARSHETAARIPHALAQAWAAQASAIADAASVGDCGRAQSLAFSLRDDVIRKEAEVPAELSAPLVASVNALADRLTCTPPPVKPPKGPPDHKHKHHGHGDGGGDQGGQG